MTCCGIGDYHGPECEDNKRNFQQMMARKKKLFAQSGARSKGDDPTGEWEKVKSTHRGACGGSGPKAPAAAVAKRSWADVAGA